MIITATTLGALTLNSQNAVKFAYLERGLSYIVRTTDPDVNGNIKVTFYMDSTYTQVQKTDYLPATRSCWFVDTTQ